MPASTPPRGVPRPTYWTRARRHLAARDATMAGVIATFPRVCLMGRGNAFVTLARSIVGQQISVKAAESIWGRVAASCPEFTPQHLLRRRATTLRACGLSERKVQYLRDLAAHFADGRLDPAALATLTDDAVIDRLTEVHGIGRWTAEMFLIFNLLRPDVLPLDDIGLLNAIGVYYFDGAPAAQLIAKQGRGRVLALAQAWVPYRSVATWYLWRTLDPIPVAY